MNNSLILFENKNRIVVSSRIISEKFSNRHNDVVTAIDNKIKK